MFKSPRIHPKWANILTEVTLRLSKLQPGDCLSSEDVCNSILRFAVEQKHWCCLCQAWSVDPRSRRMILIAQQTSMNQAPSFPSMILHDETLIGYVVQTRMPKIFDPGSRNADGLKFEFRQQISNTEIQSLLMVPIRNTSNPHQILVVLVFYLVQKPIQIPLNELANLCQQVAVELQTHLRERTYRLATRLSCDLVRDDGLRANQAYATLGKSIAKAINSDWVTVFTQSWDRRTLQWQSHTRRDGAHPTSKIETEHAIPRTVHDVFESNRELLIWPQSGSFSVDAVLEKSPPIPSSVMLVPLRNLKGASEGVIRCVKFENNDRPPFFYDDVAIVDALGQAFGPPLAMLLSAAQTDASLSKLCHELRIPVAAFGAVVERMESECTAGEYRFRHAYFEDAHIFTDMMNRLLVEVESIRKGLDAIQIDPKRTDFAKTIIRSAVRHVAPVLYKHRFQPHQLTFSGFEKLHILRVDQTMIYQVIFNLIENAIKFYCGPVDAFKCEIIAEEKPDWVEIIFRDNGPGISQNDRTEIFKYQGRGASTSNIPGSGLGLWIAKGIAEKHGGTLNLKSPLGPTEFLLTLPRNLQKSFQ